MNTLNQGAGTISDANDCYFDIVDDDFGCLQIISNVVNVSPPISYIAAGIFL